MIWHKTPTTPIWIKNPKTKLYDPIPYDKMIRFPDGKWGFNWHHCNFDPSMTEFISAHLDHFEYLPGTDVWLFRPEGAKIKRQIMLRSGVAGGLFSCLVVSITNVITGEYLWAIPAILCMATLLGFASTLKEVK